MPATTASRTDAFCPPSAPPAPTRSTILLVEDDPCVADLLALVLAPITPGILVARSGAECERLFRAHADAIALLVMDCSLPDTHGRTLAHRLRASAPGLPVLLMSGRKQPDVVQLLAADGPTEFLAKPFRPGDAVQLVREMLGVRRAA